jgi:polyisoprenoid-binding protein YceI
MPSRHLVFAVCLSVPIAVVVAHPSERAVWRIDGANSRFVIHVGKAGAFSFAGHLHEVVARATGGVSFDVADVGRSEVDLEFDSAALRVTGQGEPAQDVPEVQRVMVGERVLDAARYPKIAFKSRRVTAAPASGRQWNVTVEGDLTLHGVTKRCVVPVKVTLADGSLTAEGTTTIKQTDFGIEPVAGAGGTVRVKDTLDIVFTIVAVK